MKERLNKEAVKYTVVLMCLIIIIEYGWHLFMHLEPSIVGTVITSVLNIFASSLIYISAIRKTK